LKQWASHKADDFSTVSIAT